MLVNLIGLAVGQLQQQLLSVRMPCKLGGSVADGKGEAHIVAGPDPAMCTREREMNTEMARFLSQDSSSVPGPAALISLNQGSSGCPSKRR